MRITLKQSVIVVVEGFDTSVISQHPPHLIDPKARKHQTPFIQKFHQDQDSRNISPSALIPFCAYQTNLESLGTSIANLSFPVCTAFRPFLLQGQLCYSLDLKNTSMKGDSKLKQGIEGGIMVIIDPNSERSIRGHAPSRAKLGQGNRINLSPKAEEGRSAFVNIHTLVR